MREWKRERTRARAAAIFGADQEGHGAEAARGGGTGNSGGREDGSAEGRTGPGARGPGGGRRPSDAGAKPSYGHRAPPPREHDPPGARRQERWWSAVHERLPLWVQLRCGTTPKALGALALVLVVAVGFAVQHFWAGRPEPVRAPGVERTVPAPGPGARSPAPPWSSAHSSPSGPATDGPPGGAGRMLVVDVAGKVHRPGVHRLPAGSRVMDALQAAGGVLRGADLRGLNRARLLTDGEQILVAAEGAGATGGAGAGGPPGAGGATGGGGGAGSGTSGLTSGPLSLNSATEQQLDALPGVGPVLARHIIEFRTRHGGFTSVDQLRQVAGIGERRLADLRPLVTP
ncbi:ComEA family DNA-binding protein [Streptomyces yunnanensis]|uniref:ComEA family DNA-binding protein n=1 Tax=Streptomyces yunnanensis TaxID=156453 RepID=A0ABY8AEI2_9ACTN|nr:ComEA family DNA-binding protein [Streptomyces yunnanensis]WEB42629.1 ComEA family DNA-binding protein [Streptomyces yunnanensis]